MTVEPIRSEIKRWWEGDLRIYLDGRRQPSFHGTGHEDEYLGGWSNEWLMNPYSLPMHGASKEPRNISFLRSSPNADDSAVLPERGARGATEPGRRGSHKQ